MVCGRKLLIQMLVHDCTWEEFTAIQPGAAGSQSPPFRMVPLTDMLNIYGGVHLHLNVYLYLYLRLNLHLHLHLHFYLHLNLYGVPLSEWSDSLVEPNVRQGGYTWHRLGIPGHKVQLS